jgi:hypothetical protein
MTAPATRTRTQESKRLHLVLRDGTLVEGAIHIAEAMSLVSFLGSRKGGFINMVAARRPKLAEAPGHVIVQSDLVVLVSAPDDNVLVVGTAGAGAGERAIELTMIGGKTIKGTMYLAPMQRISDYLAQCGKFAGIVRATLVADGLDIGDIAVNTAAIALIRESQKPADAT